MTFQSASQHHYDLIIIGGGVNGAGIAADAASRGLSVLLCEQNDLASATSSNSSKLIHGGLRYLEHYQFKLVKKALDEREILLKNAPHIMHPLRFILPHRPYLRPAWMIRVGLFLYDNLAKTNTLATSSAVTFDEQSPLKNEIHQGFTYSDGWVDDARLVVLNALAAKRNGASIRTYCTCTKIARHEDHWQVTLQPKNGTRYMVSARALINAAGPWVSSLFDSIVNLEAPQQIRLVKGSHIIVPKIHNTDDAYILQNQDGRIVFVLPFEQEFSIIGTTDVEYQGCPSAVAIDDDEIDYLINTSNQYFKLQLDRSMIVKTYSGVRPLLDDDSVEAHKVTRNYTIEENWVGGTAPIISVFGGKITTYRRLAKTVVDALKPRFPGLADCLTDQVPLPGGNFTSKQTLLAQLTADFPFLPACLLHRYVRSYGTLSYQLLEGVSKLDDMGACFGTNLFAREVDYLAEHEWAVTAEDIVWRRSRLALTLSDDDIQKITQYLARPHAQKTLNTGT
ncbi:glycerol-3-phosphate dehydrogenase [Thalassotalea maritima]|uniref:glycerol-3-phosphate dehydrogenase n=1 Tax=Thalassotalea maritima TaxID=3242416 RepID=UPI00352821EC